MSFWVNDYTGLLWETINQLLLNPLMLMVQGTVQRIYFEFALILPGFLPNWQSWLLKKLTFLCERCSLRVPILWGVICQIFLFLQTCFGWLPITIEMPQRENWVCCFMTVFRFHVFLERLLPSVGTMWNPLSGAALRRPVVDIRRLLRWVIGI